jgi:hypothetical protein
MKSANTFKGLILATAAAGLFAGAGFAFAADEMAAAASDKIHCEGVNSCKGSSACKGASNECKGKNSCKGHGFLELSQGECDAAKAAMAEQKG